MTAHLLRFAFALGLAIVSLTAWTQQSNRIPVVAYLAQATGPEDPITIAWRQGLRDLGYVDGRTIRIEFRTAQGQLDRLPALAAELAQLAPDVIFTASLPAAQALRRETSTIPVVTALLDPLASGLVMNLAHPGGNVTGL